jgi:hypothetical protein
MDCKLSTIVFSFRFPTTFVSLPCQGKLAIICCEIDNAPDEVLLRIKNNKIFPKLRNFRVKLQKPQPYDVFKKNGNKQVTSFEAVPLHLLFKSVFAVDKLKADHNKMTCTIK